ncbi:MAG: hypothetical protein AABN95_19905 [Acidobacteriota bacterium]
MKRTILGLGVTCALLANVFGQQRPPSPAPTPVTSPAASTEPAPSASPRSSPTPESPDLDYDDVVRITTNLIQLDVVVTDKDGNQVTDLSEKDFEVLENGRPQEATPQPREAEPQLLVEHSERHSLSARKAPKAL